MSFQDVKAISKNFTVPISLGMLGALALGVWMLRGTVEEWRQGQLELIEEVATLKDLLSDFESRLDFRWSFLMERESAREAEVLNPGFKSPDVGKIRDDIYKATRNK